MGGCSGLERPIYRSSYNNSFSENISLWEYVLVLKGQYIHTSREKKQENSFEKIFHFGRVYWSSKANTYRRAERTIDQQVPQPMSQNLYPTDEPFLQTDREGGHCLKLTPFRTSTHGRCHGPETLPPAPCLKQWLSREEYHSFIMTCLKLLIWFPLPPPPIPQAP